MNIIKYTLKKAFQKGCLMRVKQNWNTEARLLMKSVEMETGKITPQNKKLCKEYAHDVLGWEGFSPWLELYSLRTGNFKVGWIPFTYYTCVVTPKMKGLYGEMTNANALAAKILNTDCLPNLAYYVNGLFFTPSWKVIPEDRVSESIFALEDKVVFKKENSRQGKGVYFLTNKWQISLN